MYVSLVSFFYSFHKNKLEKLIIEVTMHKSYAEQYRRLCIFKQLLTALSDTKKKVERKFEKNNHLLGNQEHNINVMKFLEKKKIDLF